MKNIAITKKGTENPNKALSTDPIIGPNNNPSLIDLKKKILRSHCFHDSQFLLKFSWPK